MIPLVYPTLPGLAFSVVKTPKFKTRTQNAVSGRELRLADQVVPRWEFTLTYNFLRDQWRLGQSGLGAGYDELRTLAGFFLQTQGSFTPFLFSDPTDSSIEGQEIGAGNGTAVAFQLVRTMGYRLPGMGFNEPILAPNLVSRVYLNGVVQDNLTYSANPATGILTFTSAPPNGAIITADFSYYFRCRFSDDTIEFENFLFQLWSAQKVKFTSLLI